MSAHSVPIRDDDADHAADGREPWGVDAFLLVLFILIQLGYSYWLSVASLAAVVTVLRLRVQLAIGFVRQPYVLALPLAMIAPLFFEHSQDLMQDLLRVGREALIACVTLLIIAGSMHRPPRVNIARITQCLTLLTLFYCLLACVQWFDLSRGIYFGFPKEIYPGTPGTIPTELDLRFSKIRPAGSFTEPSYFAFILLSMMMILSARFDPDRKGLIAAGLATAAGFLSQAGSFVLVWTVMSAAVLARAIRNKHKILIMLVIVIAVFVALTLIAIQADLTIFNRLQNGGKANGDISIFVRIVGPLDVLPSYLINHPSGLPVSAIIEALRPYTSSLGISPDQYMMNGLYNILLEYGLLGFPIAILFLLRKDFIVSLYLLSCMTFNGAFLGVDKLAVICLTIAIYEAIRRQGAENRLDEITRNRSEQMASQRKAEAELDGVRAAVGG